MKSLLVYISLLWLKLCDKLSMAECPKESMGYTCHHRIMSNGKKECGN